MKLPKRYGSVYKLKGNRYRPWVARKTIGYNEKGYPVYKYISYERTKADALKALADYNRNPYDGESITFEEAFKRWEKECTLAPNTLRHAKTAFRKVSVLHPVKVSQITLNDLRTACEESCTTKAQIAGVKKLYGWVFDYAAKYGVISTDRARSVRSVQVIAKENVRTVERKCFTQAEIDRLTEIGADIALMMIYSGVRISEMLCLKKEDVNIEEQYFSVRQSKTKAGIRDVPIADKVLKYFKAYMETESEYLIPFDGHPYIYQTFLLLKWNPWMELLGSRHTCHDTRHTCITMLTEKEVDRRVIAAIVGHKSGEITENVYTHISVKKMLEAINKI